MKRMISNRHFTLWFLSFIFSTALYAKPVTITVWHALAGHLGNEFVSLTETFNDSQKDYHIKPVYKGDYVETLTSYAAAYRAKKTPDIVQVMEVGTATMLAPKGVIKPVEQLFKEQGLPLPKQDMIQVVNDFYSKNNILMAFPLSNSIPLMYYNVDVLKKIDYKPEDFPQTWDGLEKLANKLSKAGYECAYTSAYPAWILVESYIALHGLPAYEGAGQKAIYDSPALVQHFKRLKRWQKQGYFRYGGRSDSATSLFTSGICPLYSQSSGAYNSLKDIVPFTLGVSQLPLDSKASKVRYANVIGGAALWVSAGRSAEKEKGIALFLAFLSKTNIQKRWHEQSGYLPMGLHGQYESISKQSQHPMMSLAESDLLEAKVKQSMNNKVPQHQIRTANEQAMEALFSDILEPEQAIDEAVKKANHLILRYQRNQ
jgi:sn-glycerol 3-phosphate transport system substrate-binding protein